MRASIHYPSVGFITPRDLLKIIVVLVNFAMQIQTTDKVTPLNYSKSR